MITLTVEIDKEYIDKGNIERDLQMVSNKV